ncbi:WAT1-related protein isoform X1 [Tanacetum coccineum]
MNRSLFTRIVRDLSANCHYFQEGCDVVGKAGSEVYLRDSPTSIRCCSRFSLQIGEKTSRDCLMHFCNGVIELYGEEYLRRPTQHRLYKMAVGSMSTKAYRAQFSRGDSGSEPFILLEAVASQDKWGYYLSDGIYPEWAVLMKSISQPGSNDVKRIRYK